MIDVNKLPEWEQKRILWAVQHVKKVILLYNPHDPELERVLIETLSLLAESVRVDSEKEALKRQKGR